MHRVESSVAAPQATVVFSLPRSQAASHSLYRRQTRRGARLVRCQQAAQSPQLARLFFSRNLSLPAAARPQRSQWTSFSLQLCTSTSRTHLPGKLSLVLVISKNPPAASPSRITHFWGRRRHRCWAFWFFFFFFSSPFLILLEGSSVFFFIAATARMHMHMI